MKHSKFKSSTTTTFHCRRVRFGNVVRPLREAAPRITQQTQPEQKNRTAFKLKIKFKREITTHKSRNHQSLFLPMCFCMRRLCVCVSYVVVVIWPAAAHIHSHVPVLFMYSMCVKPQTSQRACIQSLA